MRRTLMAVLVLTLVGYGSAAAQFSGKWGVPGSPTGQSVALILELVDRGDDAFTREMLAAHFTEDFVSSHPTDDFLAIFRQLHNDLPGLQPAGVERTSEGAKFRAASATSGKAISVTLVVDSAGRIAGLEIDEAPGDVAPDLDTPLEDLIDGWVEEGEFSGVVYASRDGQPLFARAYGLADRRHGVPNTMETAFNIGSLNKAFTGVAILLLEKDGKVNLDAPLGQYLDGFPDDIATKVTVRHLLQHRSGWGHYWDNETFRTQLGEMRDMQDYLAFIRDIPLDFEPGARSQYSNVGYEVLGGIIEAVSGMSYYDFVEQRIFQPLGMTRTGFPVRDYPTSGVAVGYTKGHPHAVGDGYTMENTYLLGPRGTAAGGAYSTAQDLERFFLGLAQERILDARGYAMVFNDFDESAGAPRGAIALGGGGPGVRASILFVPGDRYFAAVLSNHDTEVVERILTRMERGR